MGRSQTEDKPISEKGCQPSKATITCSTESSPCITGMQSLITPGEKDTFDRLAACEQAGMW